MNFFERQHAARGTSLRLVLLFAAAVISIVVLIDLVVLVLARGQPTGAILELLVVSTVLVLLVIAGGTVSKTLALRSGGSAVALSVGAVPVDPTTTDPQLRRFANVVEEMALASGVPMPRLFVLEKEAGINAFAAGYTPADAAITVTGGALEQLNRDELQGVIGHEFSHILNGDMRLNVKLIGLLYGILLLGLIGLRFLVFGGGGRDSKKGNPLLVVALALIVLGFVGQFFAGLIQAAVGRQREWLADASSVQFTRQTTGLAGALKKIAGLPVGSALNDAHGEKQVSHMLFGEGRKSLSRLYATHPPLIERIAALDPTFRPEEVEQLNQRWRADPPNGLAEDAAFGLTGALPPARRASERAAAATPPVRVAPAELAARVGTLTPEHLGRGAQLSSQIPPSLRQLASQRSTAIPLVLALVLDAAPGVRRAQVTLITDRIGAAEAAAATQLADQLAALAPQLRLPLVSIAAPLVTAHPRRTLDVLVTTLDDLSRVDGSISVFDYCITRLISGYIRDATNPHGRSKIGRGDVRKVGGAAFTLLAAVAATGNADPAAAQRAFTAAVAALVPGASVPYRPPADTWRSLDGVWAPLDSLEPRYKQRLVEALVVAIRDDGELTLNEAELLRTTCALLHCPLPAFIA